MSYPGFYDGGMKNGTGHVEQWWSSLNNGEKELIRGVMRMLRSAKQSQIEEVARAAQKWEIGIGCFIKVRLKHQRPTRRAAQRWAPISSPSALRNPRGVFPSRD